MSAPFSRNSLEERLARMRVLLTLVDRAFDDATPVGDDVDMMAGAHICVEEVLQIIQSIEASLPLIAEHSLSDGGVR